MTNVMLDRALRLQSHLLIDAESDALLVGLTAGAMGPAELLSLIAHGDGVIGPLRAATDPRVAPPELLEYSGQWTGGTMPPRIDGETEDAYITRARRELVRPRGIRRGTPQSLIDVAEAYLTPEHGPVRVVQNADGDDWLVLLLVRAEDVADLPGLEAALNHPEVVFTGGKIVVRTSDALLIDELTGTIDNLTGTINELVAPPA